MLRGPGRLSGLPCYHKCIDDVAALGALRETLFLIQTISSVYDDDLHRDRQIKFHEHPDSELRATLLSRHPSHLYPATPTCPLRCRLPLPRAHTGPRCPLRRSDRVPTPRICAPART